MKIKSSSRSLGGGFDNIVIMDDNREVVVHSDKGYFECDMEENNISINDARKATYFLMDKLMGLI